MSRRTLDALLNAGAVLSNLAYNISQPAVTLDESIRESARVCLKRWDDARKAHRDSERKGKKGKKP